MGQSTRFRMPRKGQVGEIQAHLDGHASLEEQDDVPGRESGWQGRWRCSTEWKYDSPGEPPLF
jgi:hypothetical protein